MKRLTQCFCVFFSLVLCFLASSVSANAEEVTKAYQVHEYGYYVNNGWNDMHLGYTYTIGEGTQEKKEVDFNASSFIAGDGTFISRNFVVSIKDGSVIAEKGKKVSVRLDNVYMSHLLTDTAQNKVYVYNTIQQVEAIIKYVDDTTIRIGATADGSSSSMAKNLKVEFTPTKDIKSIEFVVQFNVYNAVKNTAFNYSDSFKITTYVGQWISDLAPTLSVNQATEEQGLLQGIWNSLTGGFSNLANGIKDVFNKLGDIANSLLDLPGKMWQFISDGLQALYIPDDDFLTEYVERWKGLLSSTLGAVWEVAYEFSESWDRIQVADTTDIIELPEVAISLPDNCEFKFGGYDVKIVPDGFGFLAEACKMVFGMVGTMAFINGLRKKYDEIMEGK